MSNNIQVDVNTHHRKYVQNAADMSCLEDRSVDLVVTSPPYPMIGMWDACFIRQAPQVHSALADHDGWKAFDLMHGVLDVVWDEVCRVLKPGRFACINIGDAVRKTGDEFGLFSNHSRIMSAMVRRGMTPLPSIIWRKQTNAPNKFMGSGMLPAGAYVTLEHEHILVFRKGGKRTFETDAARRARRESAVFWEERNHWYSDIWFDLKGVRQQLADNQSRKRSGAFPFELPYRLINMYSIAGDTVLDPFSGIGTTMVAAMASARNSISLEIENGFGSMAFDNGGAVVEFANHRLQARIDGHLAFVDERLQSGKPLKYINRYYGFPVMTRQETDLFFPPLEAVHGNAGDRFTVKYDTSAEARGLAQTNVGCETPPAVNRPAEETAPVSDTPGKPGKPAKPLRHNLKLFE